MKDAEIVLDGARERGLLGYKPRMANSWAQAVLAEPTPSISSLADAEGISSVMSCSTWSRPMLGQRPRANNGSGGTMAPCLGAGQDHSRAGREIPESLWLSIQHLSGGLGTARE